MDAFEALAISQAFGHAFADAIKTKRADNVRGICDRIALAKWEAMGHAPVARQQPLMVNGIKVGNLSCDRHMRPEVTDAEAWEAYQTERGWLRERRPTIKLDWLTDAQFERVLRIIESMDAASCVQPSEPEWLGLAHVKPLDDGTVVNSEDGDEVPGLAAAWEYGTRISGCKPADVAAALSAGGLDAGVVMAEMMAAKALPAMERLGEEPEYELPEGVN